MSAVWMNVGSECVRKLHGKASCMNIDSLSVVTDVLCIPALEEWRERSQSHTRGRFSEYEARAWCSDQKSIHIALGELDKENAARFAFEYFVRIAQDVRAHGCRILHENAGDTDIDTDPLSSKRRLTQSTIVSLRAIPTLSHHPHKHRNSPSPSIYDDDSELPSTSQVKSTQRSDGKSTGKRNPLPPGQALETTSTEVQVLKAELAKARADAAAAAELAAEREPSGLGGSVDRLRSHAAVPVMTRRPGASLANPNKAARRVTAVEFAGDSDDEWRVF